MVEGGVHPVIFFLMLPGNFVSVQVRSGQLIGGIQVVF